MTKQRTVSRQACLTAAAALFFAAACAIPATAAETKLVTLTVRGTAQQRILLVRPDGPPTASVVLYPGGAGNIKIKDGGSIQHPGNVLVRSREHFAAEGLLVAVVDRPSDWAGADEDRFRIARAHAEDAAAIAGLLRQEAHVPVWFIGTSRGSISAANAASRLGGDKIAGVVLTSSVVLPGKRAKSTVTDTDLAGIAVPVLILGHGSDDCPYTQWPDQEALAERFKGSPSVEAIRIDGGHPGNLSDPCGPFSHHGFIDQEKAVVQRIAAWIRAHSR
jgi:pimeloyl-ACP methyl ester carboxylesterase